MTLIIYFFSNSSLDDCTGISDCIVTGKNFYWDNGLNKPKEPLSGNIADFLEGRDISIGKPNF